MGQAESGAELLDVGNVNVGSTYDRDLLAGSVQIPGKVQVKSTYTHTRENKEEKGSLRGQGLGSHGAGKGRPEGKVADRIAATSIESSLLA